MLLTDVNRCQAQETPAPAVDRQSPDLLEEFRAADRAIADAFAAYRKEIEGGQSSDKENAGQFETAGAPLHFLEEFLERGDFQSMEFFLDDGGFFSLEKLPKLKKAKEELQTALKQGRRVYKQRFPVALNELIAGTAKACREQQSAQQIAATLAQLPQYEELEKKLESPEEMLRHLHFQEQLRYLRRFKTFVVAAADGDLNSLGSVIREFEIMKLSGDISGQVKDLEEYRNRIISRFREEGATSLVEILQIVENAESAEAVKLKIAKLEEHAAIETALIGDNGIWDQRYQRGLSFLRDWQMVLTMEADEHWTEAANYVLRSKVYVDEIDPRLRALVEKRGELISAKARKAQQAKVTAVTDKLPQRIAEIATPEALQDLSDELTPLIVEVRGKTDSFAEWLQSFQTELQQIVSAWRIVGADPAFAIRALKDTRASHPWAKDSARLRDKVLRQAVVAQTGRTEFLNPPLNQIPVVDAFQKQVAAAASSSDWERVYSLLQVQTAIFPDSPGFQDVTAVKAYLTGINFEKAELFADAVQAYRTVLRNIGQNVPTKQAAERLKAILSTHPELSK